MEKELSANKWDLPAGQKAQFGQKVKQRIDLILRKEEAGRRSAPARVIALWPRIAVAASITAFILGCFYFLTSKTPLTKHEPSEDIAPFTKQAILKSGHGKTLLLNAGQKGFLARYTNTSIQKSDDEISFSNNDSSKGSAVLFDTLIVPAGGKPYHLALADGSRVIVNVASALRFPENLRSKSNEIELLKGEAFFDIRHDRSAPLVVKAKGQIIEDIGTEFDVNTYDDEIDNRTTLVGGVIIINSKRLSPGQQAVISEAGLSVVEANVEQITSWKNGYFRFNGENIKVVMREISRWYNIDVRYDGPISDEGYYIKIARSKNISVVFKALEGTNSVRFTVEGATVTVSNKN